MPILAGLVVAGLFLYLMVNQPRLRVAGAIAAAVLIAGLAYYMQTTDDTFSQAEQAFPVEDLRFDRVTFEEDARFSTLSGRVENQAEAGIVRQIAVRVRLFDCESEATPIAECAQIGEDDGVARLELPPGQLRAFEATLRFADQPRVAGVLVWEFEVTGVRARPD